MKRRDERPTRRGFELTRTPFETKRRDSSSLLAAREQGRGEASFLLLLLALSSSLALAGRVLHLLLLSSPFDSKQEELSGSSEKSSFESSFPGEGWSSATLSLKS